MSGVPLILLPHDRTRPCREVRCDRAARKGRWFTQGKSVTNRMSRRIESRGARAASSTTCRSRQALARCPRGRQEVALEGLIAAREQVREHLRRSDAEGGALSFGLHGDEMSLECLELGLDGLRPRSSTSRPCAHTGSSVMRTRMVCFNGVEPPWSPWSTLPAGLRFGTRDGARGPTQLPRWIAHLCEMPRRYSARIIELAGFDSRRLHLFSQTISACCAWSVQRTRVRNG